MKKLILIALLSLGVVSTKAATIATAVYTNNVYTNFPGIPSGPIQVKQVLIANNTSNAVTLSFYDTTGPLTNVLSAYTNYTSSLTNYLFYLTNYYGWVVTNTNYVLIDVSNSIPAVTNSVAAKMIITAAPNSTTKADSVNYYFYSGLWVSNSTAYGAGTNGIVPVTITYQ